ncbi:hypothetical protein ONS95_007505 [Cadophora gregata]|uniref:uncharacterized protein n=1 Tax=Cadophora gregata TaxID=51156 RepID=UPI0026DCC95C|nr:uncharacterized protein ONS95_007505 [Cadophora gregata]KAK0125878.1 hypothetical protein ONS95_007505 [Cadophora gregata]
MSYQTESDLGQEAGGGLHEPCWAAEAQTGNTSWRDEDLDLDSFVSGYAPHDAPRNDPSTPMAEEIATSSRYHPPLGVGGQSVDANLTRLSDNEAQTGKQIPLQLRRFRPSPEVLLDIITPGDSKLSKLSQEYFPITSLEDQSADQPSLEPPTHLSRTDEIGVPLHSLKTVEKGFSELRFQADLGEHQSMAWIKVRNVREEILGLRSRVHQARSELKETEKIKAEADNLLFKRMLLEGRGIHLEDCALPNDQKTLQQLMDDCQKTRDDYGPKEAECTSLEDQMSKLEFKLNCLEQPFFSQIEEPQPPQPTISRETSPASQPSVPESVVSTDDELNEPKYHPLVKIYLSEMADLDLLHERRDILVEEKLFLEEEKEKRTTLGMALNSDDQDWLDGSQAENDTLVKDITHLEAELVDLKKKCLDQGLIDEHGEPTDFANLEAASFHNEEDLNPNNQISVKSHNADQ